MVSWASGTLRWNRSRIREQSTISVPIHSRFSFSADSNVEPPPANGSSTISPSTVVNSMHRLGMSGFSSLIPQRALNFV